MSKTRTCAYCKNPEMVPVARIMKTYHTEYSYKCQNCGKTLELVPPASIGVGMTVSGLVLAFWGFILFRGPGDPSLLAMFLFAVAALALAWIWVPQALKYRLFPSVPNPSAQDDIHVESTTAFASRLIIPLEKMGFLAGLVAPIVLIAGILGIAALIGYVNFTFFE